MSTSSNNIAQRAGFFRRLAAMIYDCLIAVAIAMLSGLVIVTFLVVLFEQNIIANNSYQHANEFLQQSLLYKIVVQGWVLLWVSIFFLWFWKNGGQTLGMRAWRLRIYTLDENQHMGYGRLFIRLVASLCGLGTLLVLFDFKNKQSLQDRIVGTEMLLLSKDENHHKSWR